MNAYEISVARLADLPPSAPRGRAAVEPVGAGAVGVDRVSRSRVVLARLVAPAATGLLVYRRSLPSAEASLAPDATGAGRAGAALSAALAAAGALLLEAIVASIVRLLRGERSEGAVSETELAPLRLDESTL